MYILQMIVFRIILVPLTTITVLIHCKLYNYHGYSHQELMRIFLELPTMMRCVIST